MSVMNALNVNDSLEFLDDDAIIACRRMQLLVDDKSRSVNDCEDEIQLIKSNSTNHIVKLAAKVIGSSIHLVRQSTSDVRQEATLIIEALRPFIHNTIVLPTDGAKLEWYYKNTPVVHLLCSYEDVDAINKAAFQIFPGDTRAYNSVDRIADVDNVDAANARYPVEFLPSLTCPGIPPHCLDLDL
ncbi:hypothetical protein BX666DRAFT_2023343 [Dichotomocladium elegans]|nr:hypothetical protein BX666DRAFT_2023343 [Dichotomocladium elegans]